MSIYIYDIFYIQYIVYYIYIQYIIYIYIGHRHRSNSDAFKSRQPSVKTVPHKYRPTEITSRPRFLGGCRKMQRFRMKVISLVYIILFPGEYVRVIDF